MCVDLFVFIFILRVHSLPSIPASEKKAPNPNCCNYLYLNCCLDSRIDFVGMRLNFLHLGNSVNLFSDSLGAAVIVSHGRIKEVLS